jgi:hypothetical protein
MEMPEERFRKALVRIVAEIKARRWITEGRGPYRYDDDEYRRETGYALDAIEKIAQEALEGP